MKQLIFILILLLGGYYLYNSGVIDVLKNTSLDPVAFVEEVKSVASTTAAGAISKERFPKLPYRTQSREGGLKGNEANFTIVEEAVFNTYDLKTAFAWVDIVYSSGGANSSKTVQRYLSQFSIPEDRLLALDLVSKYKDRESLELLSGFVESGAFPRRTVFKKIMAYEHPEILPVLDKFIESPNAAVKKEAQRAKAEVEQTQWYTDYTSAAASVPQDGKRRLAKDVIDDAYAGNI